MTKNFYKRNDWELIRHDTKNKKNSTIKTSVNRWRKYSAWATVIKSLKAVTGTGNKMRHRLIIEPITYNISSDTLLGSNVSCGWLLPALLSDWLVTPALFSDWPDRRGPVSSSPLCIYEAGLPVVVSVLESLSVGSEWSRNNHMILNQLKLQHMLARSAMKPITLTGYINCSIIISTSENSKSESGTHRGRY